MSVRARTKKVYAVCLHLNIGGSAQSCCSHAALSLSTVPKAMTLSFRFGIRFDLPVNADDNSEREIAATISLSFFVYKFVFCRIHRLK